MANWISECTAYVGSVKGLEELRLRYMQKLQAKILSGHLVIPASERSAFVVMINFLSPHCSKKSLALIL